MVRYFLLGGIATITDMGTLFILTSGLHIWYFFSAIVAYGIGMITAFSLNRNFNFRDQLQQSYHVQALRYTTIALLGLAINQGILWILVEHAHVYYLLAKIVSVVVVSFASYAGHRVWTFGK